MHIVKKTGYNWIKSDGNLADVLPGRMIGGGVFENRKHKLPEAPGRIWFEADFDYTVDIETVSVCSTPMTA